MNIVDTENTVCQSSKDLVADALQCMEELSTRPKPSGVLSGYPSLDRLVGGFKPGSLTVISGIETSGKNSLMLNIFSNLLLRSSSPIPVGLFKSREDYTTVLVRMIMTDAGLKHHDVRKKTMSEELKDQALSSSNRLKNAPLYFMKNPGTDFVDICQRIKSMVNCYGIKIFAIDRVDEIVEWSRNSLTVSDCYRYLKKIATELDIPIVVLVNSAYVDYSDDESPSRPKLKDIPNVNAVMAYADTIMLLYRNHVAEMENLCDSMIENRDILARLEVIVPRTVTGRSGVCTLNFNPELMRVTAYKGIS